MRILLRCSALPRSSSFLRALTTSRRALISSRSFALTKGTRPSKRAAARSVCSSATRALADSPMSSVVLFQKLRSAFASGSILAKRLCSLRWLEVSPAAVRRLIAVWSWWADSSSLPTPLSASLRSSRSAESSGERSTSGSMSSMASLKTPPSRRLLASSVRSSPERERTEEEEASEPLHSALTE